MSKDPAQELNPYVYTQNRELSWLRFNRRVLEEAADETVPLWERLKFVSIFTSNLDEFFMVRVGSLFDLAQISPEKIDNKTGMTPAQQLHQIELAVPGLIALKDRLYHTLMRRLEEAGIQDLAFSQLTAPEQKQINRYFKINILPVLSAQIVDSRHPFPHLNNKSLYIAALLRGKKGGRSLGLLPLPPSLPAFLPMPENKGRFIRMENLLLHWAPSLFGSYQAEQLCVLCVTRNADISYDEEKFDDQEEDFRNHMRKLLKKRDRLSVMRLEISGSITGEFQKLLESRIQVKSRQVYFSDAPLAMQYVFALEKALPPQQLRPLQFVPYQPRWPDGLDKKRSMIEQVQQKDRLLFFPFDSIDPFLRLLSEAAERPDVISIKMTIYRLASSSKIARTLCRAAENGKEVTVLVELRARFDEENNICWSKVLEDAGCQVIYGMEDYKCHSKICLITLREKGKLRYITQIGTGNYNEKTSAMYTDLSLMTANEAIGLDGAAFFRNMLVGNLEWHYQCLWVSPLEMKARLMQCIETEIAKGPEGRICIKANAMTERSVIDKLAQASAAGVEVQLILRGICCLRPGIPKRTEKIHVTSIVGRFLEHARIYCFGKGASAQFFLSSADLMTRNLNRRVEIACPVYDGQIKKQLARILQTQLADNLKASFLLPDGSYLRKHDAALPLDSQVQFLKERASRQTNGKPEASPSADFPSQMWKKWRALLRRRKEEPGS